VRLNEPLWHDPQVQVLAYTLGAVNDAEEDLHVILNMSDEPLKRQLPPVPGRVWHRAIDTGRPSPQDILEPHAQSPVLGTAYIASPRSVLVYESRPLRP
jgi:glycogen operon protein